MLVFALGQQGSLQTVNANCVGRIALGASEVPTPPYTYSICCNGMACVDLHARDACTGTLEDAKLECALNEDCGAVTCCTLSKRCSLRKGSEGELTRPKAGADAQDTYTKKCGENVEGCVLWCDACAHRKGGTS